MTVHPGRAPRPARSVSGESARGRRGPVRPAPALRDEAGITLVEVLFAAMLIGIALIAVATVSIAGMGSLGDSRLRERATNVASEVIEQARNVPYEELANRTDDDTLDELVDWTAPTHDPDGDGCLAEEEIAHRADGAVAGDVFQQGDAPPAAGAITIRTIVTHVRVLSCEGEIGGQAKRVTVLAAWRGRDRIEGYRHHAIIARSQRGLPVPVFTVTPTQRSAAFVADDDPVTVCLAHELRNLGEIDHYEFPDLAANASLYVDANGNGQPDPDEQVIGALPRVGPVETHDTRDLLVCYAVTEDETHDVTVRSAFDHGVSATLSHAITTLEGLTFYLKDPDNTGNHTRAFGQDYTMAATAPTQSVLYNYDTNNDSLVGTGMSTNSNLDANTHVRWRHQFSEPTTLSGSAELGIWTSWNLALSESSTTAARQDYRLRVQRLSSNGQVQETLVNELFSVTQAQAGWVERTFAVELPSTTFAANEYLRVRLACVPLASPPDPESGVTEPDNCHVAYDTTAYPATFFAPTVAP